MRVKCRIIRTVFSKDEYRVFGCILTEPCKEVVLNKYGNFTIAGSYSFLDEGEEYILEIEEGKTDKYGTQYIVTGVPSLQVETLTDENELSYLEKITTPSQAKYIHEAYPNFIRLILQGDEDKIDVKNIYNVGEYRLGVYIREINTKFKYFQIVSSYPQYKFTIEDAQEISKEYKDMAEIKKQIEENPYSLMIECLGRGFEKTDRLVMDYDANFKQSPQRIEFMLLWLLSRNELDGNTKIYANALANHIKEYDKDLLPLVKEVAINSNRIYFDEETKDMAKMDTYIAECNIAYFVKERFNKPNPLQFNHDYEEFIEVDGFKLSEKQQGLLINAKNHMLSILLGYSGCGKTSSVVGLVKMLEANKMSYMLLAPTGKAAKRLSECTSRSTSTIHMAIAKGEPLSPHYLIIDEFSMVDVALCNRLFKLIDENTIVVIVGDNAQLSAIGCGNVFTDLINSKMIPVAFLDEVFRYNEGGMLKVATDIRNGVPYFVSNENEQHYGKNFTFYQADNSTAFDLLLREYEKALKKYNPNEIMVLTPYNVGDCGTYNINNAIQAIVNPPRPKQITMSRKIGMVEIKYRVGDYVLNCKNDYKAMTLDEWERIKKLDDIINLDVDEEILVDVGDSCPEYTKIYNGDTGIIRKIDDEKMVVEIDERMIVFEKSKLGQLLLSYAISTHKSQGSQASYVINLSLPMHSRMLTSNLLYVADTRSSKTMVEIGDMATIKEAIKIKDEIERNTFLSNLFN